MPKFKWPSLFKTYDVSRRTATGSSTMSPASTAARRRLDLRAGNDLVGVPAARCPFLRNRLTLVGGVRFRTTVFTANQARRQSRQYIHDDEGNILFDPVTGQALRVTGTASDITKLTNVERGIKTTNSVPGWYPSFNAVYRSPTISASRRYANSSTIQPERGGRTTTVSDLTSGTIACDGELSAQAVVRQKLRYRHRILYAGRRRGTLGWFRKDLTDFVNQIRYDSGTPQRRRR